MHKIEYLQPISDMTLLMVVTAHMIDAAQLPKWPGQVVMDAGGQTAVYMQLALLAQQIPTFSRTDEQGFYFGPARWIGAYIGVHIWMHGGQFPEWSELMDMAKSAAASYVPAQWWPATPKVGA